MLKWGKYAPANGLFDNSLVSTLGKLLVVYHRSCTYAHVTC